MNSKISIAMSNDKMSNYVLDLAVKYWKPRVCMSI